ncbi:MAG: hypothetical protein H6906_06075 [Hyphomicrobiales bacterium]|nr:hypothetical protein [Hyphomicrobiales bacterium]
MPGPGGGLPDHRRPVPGRVRVGVSALNSGAYERRLDQKRGELQNEQWRQQQLQRDLEAARREQANVSAEVREAQQREDALRSEIADLDRRIAVAEQSRTADRAKLARVKEEVEELERAQRLLQADPVIDIEVQAPPPGRTGTPPRPAGKGPGRGHRRVARRGGRPRFPYWFDRCCWRRRCSRSRLRCSFRPRPADVLKSFR